MNPTVVIWILAVVVAVLVGREVGKWLFGENAKLMAKKRAAQVLAGKLRDNGLKLFPPCWKTSPWATCRTWWRRSTMSPSWSRPAATPSRRNWSRPTRTSGQEAGHARGPGLDQGEDRRDRGVPPAPAEAPKPAPASMRRRNRDIPAAPLPLR